MRREPETKGLLFGAAALASLIAGPAFADCNGSLGTINSPTYGSSGNCNVGAGSVSTYQTFTNALAWANVVLSTTIADIGQNFTPSGNEFALYKGEIGSGTFVQASPMTWYPSPKNYWQTGFTSYNLGAGNYYVVATGDTTDTVGVTFSLSTQGGAPAPIPGAGMLSLAFFLLAGAMSPTAAPLRRELKRRLAI